MTASLLQRSARGDVDAFMRFYDATCAVTYRWALLIDADRERAGRRTCAIYERAWRSAAQQPSSGLSPLAWLITLGSVGPEHA